MRIKRKQSIRKCFVVSTLALTVIFFSSMDSFNYSSNAIRRVVLDAGHGGKDPGNLGTGRYKITEKNITLDVTLQLGEYITKNFPDVEVIYTRDKDSFPTLNDRVEKANDEQADLFISVHCDAFTKSTARGSGTYVMGMHKSEESLRVAMQENASIYLEDNYQDNYQGFDPKDPDTYIIMAMRQNVFLDHSLNLSQKIQDQFRDRVGRVDRGVRQAGYYVISFTTMPSVLIELGFLTNPEEEDFLNSENGKSYMASAIYRAFRDYKSEIEGLDIEDLEGEENIEPVAHTVDVQPEKFDSEIEFAVQIVTSSDQISLNNEAFKGLKDVKEYASNGLFKYAAGHTPHFEEAKEKQNTLRDMGFDGAFVVAFKGNERIDLHEAIRQTSK